MITGIICKCMRCEKEFLLKIQEIEPDDIQYFNNAYCNSCTTKTKCIKDIKEKIKCQ